MFGGRFMLSALGQYIKKHPVVYFFGSLFAILTGVLALVPNYIIQLFIDNIIADQLTADLLGRYLLIFIVSAFAIYFSDMSWIVLLFGQSSRYQKELRQTLFRRLLVLRTPFYEKFRSGDLMTRMTTDIDMMGNAIGYGFMIVIADGTYMVSVLYMMAVTISWQATILSVLPLIVFGIIIYFIGMEVDRRYEKSREAVAQLSNEVLEVVDGVRVIRAYGRKELEQDRFQKRTAEVVATSNRLIFLNGLFGPVARVFNGLSTAAGLFYGGYLVSQGQMTVGQLITFQIYLGMLNGVVWGMADLVAIYQQAQVSYRKIQELEQADDLIESSGNKALDRIDSIEFNQYKFTYPGDEQETLKEISFSLNRGQTLGIVGKTGSGKSTIIRQLMRQYPVEKAESLRINGLPITDYKIDDIEKMIGYVPQEHILFSRTVEHNIAFGNQEANSADLAQAIQAADFSKDLDRMPEGLETMIGEKGVAISGGQKQRISMARALIRQPELLIMDDSLSAVDAKTERAIIQNIQNLRKDKTNIIITHRLSAVAHADIVLVIEDGQVSEAGSPDQLLAAKGWYYEQFERQQLGENAHEDI